MSTVKLMIEKAITFIMLEVLCFEEVPSTTAEWHSRPDPKQSISKQLLIHRDVVLLCFE